MNRCNECNSTDIVRHGKYRSRKGTFQKYKCNHCGHFMIGELIPDINKRKKTIRR